MKRYKAAQQALNTAREKQDDGGVQTAQDELNALILFKSDMGACVRLYMFLSQIFGYGNIESWQTVAAPAQVSRLLAAYPTY